MPDKVQIAKSMPQTLTRVGIDGIIEGFPAIFGNRDDDGEVVEKGAFAKSIAERATRIPVSPSRWITGRASPSRPTSKRSGAAISPRPSSPSTPTPPVASSVAGRS